MTDGLVIYAAHPRCQGTSTSVLPGPVGRAARTMPLRPPSRARLLSCLCRRLRGFQLRVVPIREVDHAVQHDQHKYGADSETDEASLSVSFEWSRHENSVCDCWQAASRTPGLSSSYRPSGSFA